MIGAQILLFVASIPLAIAATYEGMPSKWRVAAGIAAAIHAAPLLITMWRYALLGGGE